MTLVLHLPFKEPSGTTVYDQSGYDNHGTIYGASRVKTKMFRGLNRTLNSDGIDDYVVVPHSPSLSVTTGITVVAGVKVDSWINTTPRVLCKPDVYDVRFDAATMQVLFGLQVGGIVYVVNTVQALSSGVHYHIAAVYDSVTSFKICINGQSVALGGATGQTGNIDTNTADVMIGNYPGLVRNLDGILSEVRIYNRALSTLESLALHMRMKRTAHEWMV